MMDRNFLDKLYSLSQICGLFEDAAFAKDEQYFLAPSTREKLFSIAKKIRVLMMVCSEADEEQRRLVVPKIEQAYRFFYVDPTLFSMIEFLWNRCENPGMLKLREIPSSLFEKK